MFLIKLIKKFNQNKIPYALVGGHAVAIHGAVRGTMDVDFVLKWTLDTLTLTEKTLKNMGLMPRLPISATDVFNFKDEYINNRNLIDWNFYNPTRPSEQVDIIITHDLTNLKTIKVRYQDVAINVLSKKDLIKMKKHSGRKQDLLDIDALEKLP